MSNISTNSKKISVLEAAFGKSKLAKAGTNISVVCPVCKLNAKKNSSKKKLSIDLGKGIYHCWVCESKGRNIGQFVRKHTNASKKIIAEIYDIFEFNDNVKKEDEIIVKLPDDFILLSESNSTKANIAKRYLFNRGVTQSDLLKFKIGISGETDFINRFIIPSFDDNLKLNYFLSRTHDQTQKIKYRNCDAKRSDIIFNEYFIDWTKTVYLVEGVFDAIKSPPNTIPMLGSWIDEKYALFRKIVIEGSEVVLCLDPDAQDKAMKIAERFNSYGNKVHIVNNKDKDFGDMTKEEVNFYIQSAKLYEQTDRMTYLIQSISSGSIF